MNIVNFDHSHLPKASELLKSCYEMEREHVPFLPKIESFPDLTHFADNQLGVAAFEGNRLLGYLCAYNPMEDAYGTTNVRGIFSPIHAHGVSPVVSKVTSVNSGISDRDRIYTLMYQAAAEKWVRDGILNHAIALYTHDNEAINSFFYNGFGLRCIDAIRELNDIPKMVSTPDSTGKDMIYEEVPRKAWGNLLKCHNGLISHISNSPIFMCFDSIDEEELYNRTSQDVRYFAVRLKDEYIAYVKIGAHGENFVTEQDLMMNICGAYCLPEYRGKGIYHNLIVTLMETLKREGILLLGVDCESFNPNARGLWLKYFTEYTHSVVRRIDDKAIGGIKK